MQVKKEERYALQLGSSLDVITPPQIKSLATYHQEEATKWSQSVRRRRVIANLPPPPGHKKQKTWQIEI